MTKQIILRAGVEYVFTRVVFTPKKDITLKVGQEFELTAPVEICENLSTEGATEVPGKLTIKKDGQKICGRVAVVTGKIRE